LRRGDRFLNPLGKGKPGGNLRRGSEGGEGKRSLNDYRGRGWGKRFLSHAVTEEEMEIELISKRKRENSF